MKPELSPHRRIIKIIAISLGSLLGLGFIAFFIFVYSIIYCGAEQGPCKEDYGYDPPVVRRAPLDTSIPVQESYP